jgi:hypothetical protein
MRSVIERATKKLRRSGTLLEYRRLNWRVETNHRIRWEFEAFVVEARALGFPFSFTIRQYDTPNEGVVQISSSPHNTGVVDRVLGDDWDGREQFDSPVIETGGDLVASLSATGLVHFIAHPRVSKRLTPRTKELFLLRPYEPTNVTVKVIRKALRQYLLILQESSILGLENAITHKERVLVWWIRFRDLRSRYEFYTSLLSLRNEWGKALIAGVIAFLVGYISGGKQ